MLGYTLSVLLGIVIIALIFVGGFCLGVIATKKVVNDQIKAHDEEFVDKWKEKHMKGV